MALEGASIRVCSSAPCSGLSASDFGSSSGATSVSLRLDLEKLRRWECGRLSALTQRATTPVEDEKPHTPEVESYRAIERTQGIESLHFQKDLSFLPSELTQNPTVYKI